MIKANFDLYNHYVTDSVHQWEINRVLSVSGLNLSVAPEIHFQNANMDRAIVRQSKLEKGVVTVDIPNSLLQDPIAIVAFIGIYESNEFKVIESVRIPVIPRKRPLDYQIQDNDEEIYSFTRLETAIRNIENQLGAGGEAKPQVVIVSGVMLAPGWNDKLYSFESEYPVADYNIEIALDSTATIDQVEAFNEAQIVGSAVSNTVKAYGTVPSVNIPIIIKAVSV